MLGTPLALSILVHYSCTTAPVDNLHADAVVDTIRYLCENDMLESTEDRLSFTATDKGLAMVDHLISIPFPVQHWIVPAPEGNS